MGSFHFLHFLFQMRSGKASTSTAPIFYGSNEKEEKLLLQFAESGRKEGVQELINRGVRKRIDYVCACDLSIITPYLPLYKRKVTVNRQTIPSVNR